MPLMDRACFYQLALPPAWILCGRRDAKVESHSVDDDRRGSPGSSGTSGVLRQAVELSAGVKKKPHGVADYRRTHTNLFSTFESAFVQIHCPVAQARCRKCIAAMP